MMTMTKSILSIALFLMLNTLNAQSIEGVNFEDDAVKVSNTKKAKVDYASHPFGKTFKTILTQGYNENKVNFGGHYVCVLWGGQGTSDGAIVDITTGKIYALPLTMANSSRQTSYNNNENIFSEANSNLFVCFRNAVNQKDPNLVNLYYHFYKWNDNTKKFSLIKKKDVIVSVESDAIVNDIPTDVTITLNQKGIITLGGKEIALDNLKKELQNRLVKYAVVPNEVPIKTIGETGMGMRAEVRTEVTAAISGAKWLKKSKTATKSAATTPSVSVNNKGEITLSGKKVSLENLRKELQKELLKLSVIPNEIPITFGNQLLMALRGEVRTEVSGAIKGAKWLKKKAALSTK